MGLVYTHCWVHCISRLLSLLGPAGHRGSVFTVFPLLQPAGSGQSLVISATATASMCGLTIEKQKGFKSFSFPRGKCETFNVRKLKGLKPLNRHCLTFAPLDVTDFPSAVASTQTLAFAVGVRHRSADALAWLRQCQMLQIFRLGFIERQAVALVFIHGFLPR